MADSIACAGHSFWLKNDCKVAENAKPIYYQQGEKLYRFYDIDDVSGDFKENYWIWNMRDEKLDADFSEAVNRKLMVQYSLDDTSLEQTIYNIVLQKTADKINVNSDLYAVVTESAAFAVIHRCCPGAVEMSNENLSALGKIDINEIGENVTAITKEVLSEIENMVKAERTAIIDRSKLDEYNNDKQHDMPVKSTGQIELSDSENTDRENLHIRQALLMSNTANLQQHGISKINQVYEIYQWSQVRKLMVQKEKMLLK